VIKGYAEALEGDAPICCRPIARSRYATTWSVAFGVKRQSPTSCRWVRTRRAALARRQALVGSGAG